MKAIDRDTLSSLYKKQKNIFRINFFVSFFLWFAAIILCNFLDSGAARFAVIAVVVILQLLFLKIFKRITIPKGNGRNVMKAMQHLNNDFTSDAAVNRLYELIGKTEDFSDKTMLMSLLSDVYNIRGQYGESISILNSVDRSRLVTSPEIGMTYYMQVISTYSQLKDDQSVIAAYNDAEPFIEECSHRNYNCCSSAMNILILVEGARKNYRNALELRLAKNEFENKLNRDASFMHETPLKRFVRGSVFMSTAELFYYNGDYANAAKYLDIGGPLVSVTPCMTERANELSAKLREKLNLQRQ